MLSENKVIEEKNVESTRLQQKYMNFRKPWPSAVRDFETLQLECMDGPNSHVHVIKYYVSIQVSLRWRHSEGISCRGGELFGIRDTENINVGQSVDQLPVVYEQVVILVAMAYY